MFFSKENLKAIQPQVNMCRVPVCKNNPPDGAHCMCFLSKSQRLVTVTTASTVQISAVSKDGRLVVEHTFPQISSKFFSIQKIQKNYICQLQEAPYQKEFIM